MTDHSSATDPTHLPLDPDLDVDDSAGGDPRPVHLRPSYLALVFAGGTVGTAAREALSLAIPSVNGVPYAIFGINIVGAFLLGVLLDILSGRGPDRGHRRTVRLLLGTGVMGGFTTYSALATDSAALIGGGTVGVGIGYGILTVLIGAAATWGGIAVAGAIHRPTQRAADMEEQ
jgi:CrcB protein